MKMMINTPRDVVWEVLNAKSAIIREAIEINEKRRERYQEELPLPKLNCGEMLQMVKEFARKEFIKRKELNNPLPGTVEKWETEATNFLGEELLRHARRSEDDELLKEVWKVWPEHAPGPDLTPEQIKELVNLQDQADEIMENLLETVKNAFDELQTLIKAEKKIIENTSAVGYDGRGARIYNNTEWYYRMLREVIQRHWFNNAGILKYRTVDEAERDWAESRPRRWSK